MDGTIFISYRRGADSGFAGRLYDRLENAFGRQRVFMDVDSIAPGEDFVAVLEARVAECDVLLALIGRGWLAATNEAGQRRLDNPDDFVRIEIAAALAQGKRVIPVVVDDVSLPRTEELPEEIKPLARRQAIRVTHARFKDDAAHLLRALERVLTDVDAARQVEEEARQRRELERQRNEEEARRHAEATRKAEEDRQRRELERQRNEEEARRHAEATQKAEEDRQRVAAEAKRQAQDQERQRAERERQRTEAEAERQAREKDRRRAEDEACRKAEAARRAQDEERQRAEKEAKPAGDKQKREARVPFRLIAGLAVTAVVLIAIFGIIAREQATEVVAQREQGSVFRDCKVCPEMVALPGGTFLMGSPAGEEERWNDEGPQHEVTISPFAIGKYEVTFEEWDACVAAGGCNGYRPDDKGWGRGRRPVINVSWNNAKAYCDWLANKTGKPYRLPSEAEWEYAARAGTATRYAFGNEITEKEANFGGNVGKTTAVGAYPANAWGLYDMHGNVWEWVEDGQRTYTVASVTDPIGPTGAGAGRVIRGGSRGDDARSVRSAHRSWFTLGYRSAYLGFRCARVQS